MADREYAAHVCKCKVCSPGEFADRPQEGPGYYSVTQRDFSGRQRNVPKSLHIYVDGVEVQSVTEALAGSAGFVVHHVLPLHRCDHMHWFRGGGVCAERLTGVVQITAEFEIRETDGARDRDRDEADGGGVLAGVRGVRSADELARQ